MRSWLILTLVLMAGSVLRAEDSPLVIHEWGTFTSLQNEKGEAIGGINTDDEPVPSFVHGLDSSLIDRSPSETERRTSKGIFELLHPDVTMRLETPVVYFYRPAGSAGPMKVDLSVTFHGGYLSQYYPNVSGPAPVVTQDYMNREYKPVTSKTTHALNWPNLQVGTDGVGPITAERVWTAPREVKADNVTSEKGESEKFLFYRGVGHLDGPLQAHRAAPQSEAILLSGHASSQPAWLVDIRGDGTVAFARSETLSAAAPPATQYRGFFGFKPVDYNSANLTKLRDEFRQALIASGLFADEADAMLNTWEASYFKAPGLRVFYIVPPAWTEQVLPMTVSVPAKITRVMVGRIELIAPEQQALLGTISDVKDVPKLGRFYAALLNEEQRLRPSDRLAKLIEAKQCAPAKVARSVAAR